MTHRVWVIGQGAFLTRTVRKLTSSGFSPIVHETSIKSSSLKNSKDIFSRGNPNINDPGESTVPLLTPVILANNPYILSDDFLTRRTNVFNLHNSDVQLNRGLAQICILDSMLTGSQTFGTTLQKLTPRVEVDSSPTLHIESFKLTKTASFEEITIRTSEAWFHTLDRILIPSLENNSPPIPLQIEFGPIVSPNTLREKVYGQKMFNEAIQEKGLGNLAKFFPRTNALVEEFQNFWRDKEM